MLLLKKRFVKIEEGGHLKFTIDQSLAHKEVAITIECGLIDPNLKD